MAKPDSDYHPQQKHNRDDKDLYTGDGPLMEAVRGGNLDVVKYLVDPSRGADPRQTTNKKGYSPFHQAVISPRAGVFRFRDYEKSILSYLIQTFIVSPPGAPTGAAPIEGIYRYLLPKPGAGAAASVNILHLACRLGRDILFYGLWDFIAAQLQSPSEIADLLLEVDEKGVILPNFTPIAKLELEDEKLTQTHKYLRFPNPTFPNIFFLLLPHHSYY